MIQEKKPKSIPKSLWLWNPGGISEYLLGNFSVGTFRKISWEISREISQEMHKKILEGFLNRNQRYFSSNNSPTQIAECYPAKKFWIFEGTDILGWIPVGTSRKLPARISWRITEKKKTTGESLIKHRKQSLEELQFVGRTSLQSA